MEQTPDALSAFHQAKIDNGAIVEILTSRCDSARHMTYAVNHETFASWFGRKAFTKSNAVASEGGILPRILDAIFESHERQADREIIPFVAQSGESLTDGIEREIMQRASIANSTPRW